MKEYQYASQDLVLPLEFCIKKAQRAAAAVIVLAIYFVLLSIQRATNAC